ncbi:hypothetical protein [uncultured Thiodictyon sp.]|uniref:Spy/CpxP family protein refolding chaperone n=1 Tax=uncultured Thiodictyon sp. TaxID=1846217 RepID=UPI0025CCBC2A|nr:hypothetical protein [uncultured Thiodictyon sp.]
MTFTAPKTLLAIAIGIATTAAFAGPGGPRGDHAWSADKHLAQIAERLHLTPEQQSQVKTIIEEEHAAAERLHQDARKRIDGVLTDSQRAEQNAEMNKRMGQHVDRLAKRLNLTDEQTTKVRAILEEQRDQPGLDRTAIKDRIATVLTPAQRQQLESMGPRDERPGKQDCEPGHDHMRDGPMGGPDGDLADAPDGGPPAQRSGR